MCSALIFTLTMYDTLYLLSLHVIFVGFGSHSPFSIHFMDSGPERVCPAGQLSVMEVPSNTGTLVDPLTPIELELLNGLSHVPV
jgi:hypothetical protein